MLEEVFLTIFKKILKQIHQGGPEKINLNKKAPLHFMEKKGHFLNLIFR